MNYEEHNHLHQRHRGTGYQGIRKAGTYLWHSRI